MSFLGSTTVVTFLVIKSVEQYLSQCSRPEIIHLLCSLLIFSSLYEFAMLLCNDLLLIYVLTFVLLPNLLQIGYVVLLPLFCFLVPILLLENIFLRVRHLWSFFSWGLCPQLSCFPWQWYWFVHRHIELSPVGNKI